MCRTALTEYLLGCLAADGRRPDEAMRARLARFIDPTTSDDAAGFSLEERTALHTALLSCRVCDPAAGEGALLLAMLEELHAMAARLARGAPGLASLTRPGGAACLRREIAARLHGADISEQAVRRCRTRLHDAVGPEDGPGPRPDCSRQIVCADSLLGRPFADFKDGAGFDLVLLNPPYVSFGLRGAGPARAAWAEAVRKRYPRSAEYKLSSYAVFMDMALALTRPGGICCCLTPDSYLLGRYYRKLRRRILDDCAIRAVVLIEEDFWDRAVVGRPVIGVFRTGKPSGEQPILSAARCRTVADLARYRLLSCPGPQNEFEQLRHHRFRLLFSEEDRRFVAALEHGAGRLGDVVAFASGLIGRHGRDSIVAPTQRSPTWRRGLDSGADVQPYRVRYRGQFLNFDPQVLKSGFRNARYELPKVLLRQTGDALVAAYDPDGLYCLNNVHVGNAMTAVDVRLVVAILNSGLMNRYYRLISLEGGRALAQIDLDVVEDLPFKRPLPADEERILDLVTGLQSGRLSPREANAATEMLERIVRRVYLPAE
jgi:hypothetical protein